MKHQKTALVLGAGGFIGNHLVKRLMTEGYWVRGVDLKHPEYSSSQANEFIIGDLRDPKLCKQVVDRSFSEVYQLAADMGGAGYIFTGKHDADIMNNSAKINLNILASLKVTGVGRVFFSSSACIYPEHNQLDTESPTLVESSAYPAAPDSEYGWEKIFSERIFLAYHRNYGLPVRIARFHNIFGTEGTWDGGREKAPAAICRKVAMASNNGEVEVWGDGKQTRSFLYIDECLDGVRKLMDHQTFTGPVNIGSTEMISINQLVDMVAEVAGKTIHKKHIEGPQGVRGRTSDNRLIWEKLSWQPIQPLIIGIEKTYRWIEQQVNK